MISSDCQVMEFCEAGDLFTLIAKQRGKPLQEELIFFFFLQVMVAVAPEEIETLELSRWFWL